MWLIPGTAHFPSAAPLGGLGTEIGWWCPSSDDTGNGTTTLYDLIGSNNGTLTNMDAGTDWVADTGSGGVRCLDLDGTDDYVSIPDDDIYTFGSGGTDSPFSVSVWINMAVNQAFSPISKCHAHNNGEWYLYCVGGYIYWAMLDGPSSYCRSRATQALSTGTWYHLAATYDGSEDYTGCKIYVNGSLMALTQSTAGSYAGMTNSTATVKLGVRGSGQYLNGKIDDARIFAHELSAGDITHLATARGVTGTP